MLNKIELHNTVLEKLAERIQENQHDLQEIKISLTSDTKSSAGDKHETSRAHLQIEMEQISNQLSILLNHRQALRQIDPEVTSIMVEQGSLVETSIGFFYFSTSIGKISFKNTSAFCLSLTAPLGKEMMGKTAGDTVAFNGKKIQILNIA